MSRRCPSCRLPRKPIIVCDAIVDKHYCIVALCQHCRLRLKTVPRHSIKRALHRAAVQAASDPEGYWFVAFTDKTAAQLTIALLQNDAMFNDTAKALGWQLDEQPRPHP